LRCHYLSDLHLETQAYRWPLPNGDILIIAGDLCHARCLDAPPDDGFLLKQRDRVLRFIDEAQKRFAHVLLIAGNHDHYDAVFSDTIGTLRRGLPGITVLDNEAVELGGMRFFGGTLWTDCEGRTKLDAVRKKCGEFFFVKVREPDGTLRKFRPEDAVSAFDTACRALRTELDRANGNKLVVITHHAPSRKGLNPYHAGNGLDAAYASDLEPLIAETDSVAVWVHGHTHIRRVYRIGRTDVRTDARGFDGRDLSARSFTGQSFFDLQS
jgi:Icc-related predicted phosphoesterase